MRCGRREGWECGRGRGQLFLPVFGVKLRSVSDDEDWRLHGLEGEKGGGEEEEVGRALKGVGGPEDEGRSSPNTGLPGEHDTHTRQSPHPLSACACCTYVGVRHVCHWVEMFNVWFVCFGWGVFEVLQMASKSKRRKQKHIKQKSTDTQIKLTKKHKKVRFNRRMSSRSMCPSREKQRLGDCREITGPSSEMLHDASGNVAAQPVGKTQRGIWV